MALIKKIFTSVWETISVLWGGRVSDESLIIGLVTMFVMVGVFFVLFAIFNKFTKLSTDKCSFAAIGVDIALIFVFCMSCLIFTN